MKPLQAGLVGLGSVAQRGLIPHLLLDRDPSWVALTAVCDNQGRRAEQIAADYAVRSAYTDYREMFDQQQLDMALIATPVPSHFEIAMAAIERGVHVYLQKPMVSNLDEADQLIEAADKAGVRILAAPGQMLSPGLQRLKRLIAEERIGRFYWAFANTAFIGHEHEGFRAKNPVDPSWYYRKPGGGPVNSMAVYSLHTLTGVLGPVQKVAAMSGIGLPTRSFRGQPIEVEMDDNSLFLLDFGESRFAMVGAQFAQMGRVVDWGFTGFYGSKGALEITGRLMDTAFPGQLTVNPPDLAGELELPHPDFDDEALPYLEGRHMELPEGHVYMDVCHLAECIREDREPVPSAGHARHVIEVIERAYTAAETGITQAVESRF